MFEKKISPVTRIPSKLHKTANLVNIDPRKEKLMPETKAEPDTVPSLHLVKPELLKIPHHPVEIIIPHKPMDNHVQPSKHEVDILHSGSIREGGPSYASPKSVDKMKKSIAGNVDHALNKMSYVKKEQSYKQPPSYTSGLSKFSAKVTNLNGTNPSYLNRFIFKSPKQSSQGYGGSIKNQTNMHMDSSSNVASISLPKPDTSYNTGSIVNSGLISDSKNLVNSPKLSQGKPITQPSGYGPGNMNTKHTQKMKTTLPIEEQPIPHHILPDTSQEHLNNGYGTITKPNENTATNEVESLNIGATFQNKGKEKEKQTVVKGDTKVNAVDQQVGGGYVSDSNELKESNRYNASPSKNINVGNVEYSHNDIPNNTLTKPRELKVLPHSQKQLISPSQDVNAYSFGQRNIIGGGESKSKVRTDNAHSGSDGQIVPNKLESIQSLAAKVMPPSLGSSHTNTQTYFGDNGDDHLFNLLFGTSSAFGHANNNNNNKVVKKPYGGPIQVQLPRGNGADILSHQYPSDNTVVPTSLHGGQGTRNLLVPSFRSPSSPNVPFFLW